MCVVAEVRKNASETIRVRPTEYNGAELVDVRVWYESATGEMKPTKKGLTLRPEMWQELLPEIEQALPSYDQRSAHGLVCPRYGRPPLGRMYRIPKAEVLALVRRHAPGGDKEESE